MKRMYEKPMAYIENFTSNEYVAACYYLACQVGPGEKNGSNGSHWHENEKGGVDHAALGTPKTCADKSANRVITDNGLLSDSQVGEYNGQQGWITGGIDDWVDSQPDGKVNAGDYIYWHTVDSDGNRRWNHYGKLELVSNGKPNHS